MKAGNNKLVEAFAFYYDHPVEFVRDILKAEPNADQVEILNAVAGNRFVAVKSGHGIGKTAAFSWLILWFMCTRPHCKVPCTAPTGHQLHDILWPEVGKWVLRSGLSQVLLHGAEKLTMLGHEKTWFAVPRASDKPENMQGFHAKEVLFIIDEASGMAQDIMEVVEGALTTEGARLVMGGNPTKISGTFFNAFHGDRTHYKTLSFSSEKSSNVAPEYCQRIAEKFGAESDVYRVRVLGQFPKGTPDAFITLSDVEPAINRAVPEEGPASIGVDPARYGDDFSQICSRRGLKVYPFQGFHGINTVRLTGEISRAVKALRGECKETVDVKVDDTGVGGGVTDQLQELTGLDINVMPINFGGTSNDLDYADKAAQMWGRVKELLKFISLPDDQELISQLTTRRYRLMPDGKIKLERKEDMKKRGLASPDKADALALAFEEGNRIGVDFI